MIRAKGTTPKEPQFKMKQEGALITNNGGNESSFRVLYYGDASAGSVPFMWESQPGTPKHPTTESPLPPLTLPPAFHYLNQKYNSSKQPNSLRSLFLASSSKRYHGGGDNSSTGISCFGGGLVKAYRMKKLKNALMSIGVHGKIHNN